MNEYRIRGTGQVLNERELRAKFENVSFPPVLDVPTLNSIATDPVFESPAPAVTTYQSPVRNGVVQDGNSNWVWAWTVRDWTAEEKTSYDAKVVEDQRQAAIDATITGDNQINALKAMTNAEFDTWWTNNITTGTQAAIVANLAGVVKKIVRIMVRRLL